MTRSAIPVFVVAATMVVAAQRPFDAAQSRPVPNAVIRLDPALDAVIAPNAQPELLKGDYFGAVEGPVWVETGGYLLFSDMAANVIYKWTPDGQLSVFLEKSGYTGTDVNNVGGQY